MVKNQHYVPRFYLKNFLNDQGRFWAFHKDSQKVFLTTPEQVAKESFFYDLPGFDEAFDIAQPTEQYLSMLEAKHAPALVSLLESIDSRQLTRLDRDHREMLCEFIVLQILRTKEYRIESGQMFSQISDKLKQSGWLSKAQINEMDSFDNEPHIISDQLQHIMLDTPFKGNLTGILSKHIWMVFKNMTEVPYYTSDQPVVRYPHVILEGRGNSGFKSKGIEVAIPLSSSHLLVLVERSHFKTCEQYENYILLNTDPQNVIFYNSLQVLQCHRAIMSCKNEFDLPREMIESSPALGVLKHFGKNG